MSHVAEGELHAYLDGELSGAGDAGSAELVAHLERCPLCYGHLEEARQFRDRARAILAGTEPEALFVPPFEAILVRSEPEEEPAPRGWRIARAPGLAWAATVLLALGVGWWGRSVNDPHGGAPSLAATQEEAAMEATAPEAPPAPALTSPVGSDAMMAASPPAAAGRVAEGTTGGSAGQVALSRRLAAAELPGPAPQAGGEEKTADEATPEPHPGAALALASAPAAPAELERKAQTGVVPVDRLGSIHYPVPEPLSPRLPPSQPSAAPGARAPSGILARAGRAIVGAAKGSRAAKPRLDVPADGPAAAVMRPETEEARGSFGREPARAAAPSSPRDEGLDGVRWTPVNRGEAERWLGGRVVSLDELPTLGHAVAIVEDQVVIRTTQLVSPGKVLELFQSGGRAAQARSRARDLEAGRPGPATLSGQDASTLTLERDGYGVVARAPMTAESLRALLGLPEESRRPLAEPPVDRPEPREPAREPGIFDRLRDAAGRAATARPDPVRPDPVRPDPVRTDPKPAEPTRKESPPATPERQEQPPRAPERQAEPRRADPPPLPAPERHRPVRDTSSFFIPGSR